MSDARRCSERSSSPAGKSECSTTFNQPHEVPLPWLTSALMPAALSAAFNSAVSLRRESRITLRQDLSMVSPKKSPTPGPPTWVYDEPHVGDVRGAGLKFSRLVIL